MRWPGAQIIVWPSFVLSGAVFSVWWGVRREGLLALFWGVPLLGSLLAMAVAGRRRGWSVAGSMGGAAAGATLCLTNYMFFRRLTAVTVFDSSYGAFPEAMGGGVAGAFIGLLAAAVVCLPTALSRLTIRDWIVLVAIFAVIMVGAARFMRSIFIDRVLIGSLAFVVIASGLLFVRLRNRYACRANPPRREREV